MSCYFIPLGGGDEVGASAYFLSVDGIKILLDCGARLRGEELYPDYERMLCEITDYSELDLIIISHGHYDHIGSFARIASLAINAEIITTDDTKSLIYLQLLGFGRISGRAESDRVKNEKYLMAQAMMDRIHTYPVMIPFETMGCKITFMPAGHMLGAVMIYIESKNHRILYSGDFSMRTMFGFNGMKLMENINPSVLLLNAPNVYTAQEEWDRLLNSETNRNVEADRYDRLERIVKSKLEAKKNVYLVSKSIPKHLDLFYFLRSEFPDTPVALEPKSKKIADSLSEMGYNIYGANISESGAIPEGPHIFVGQEESRVGCSVINFDGYSLHASPDETLEFVKETGASDVYLLHVYPLRRKTSIKDVLAKENGDISITQTVNGSKYYLKREDEMKHSQILQDVLEKKLAKANGMLNGGNANGNKLNSSVIANEWVGIYGSLMYPEEHPRAAYRAIPRQLLNKYDISFDDYMMCLRSVNMDEEGKRNYVLSSVENGTDFLKKALDGDKKAAEKFIEFSDNLYPRDHRSRKRFFIGKCLLVFMLLIDPDFKDEKYLPILRAFGSRYCNQVIYDINARLREIYGLSRKKRTAKDVIEKTERALTESTAAADEFNSDNELERLKFANMNYKNSLELVQAMLDELNETIDETAEDAKSAAIASFYSSMNSDDYGNLLDSIELVEKRLKALRKDKVKIPPQLAPLTIVFKQLLRFVKESGITAIETTGREFETDVEGLAEYTYIGEAFSASDETKTVVVERPGWKFNSTVLSLPTVREKDDEGSMI